MKLPELTSSNELAAHFGMNERGLKEWARRLGVGRKLGKRFAFTDGDIAILIEDAKPCHSGSTNGAKSGTTPERLPEGDFAALQARLTNKSRNKLPSKKNKPRGVVVSMDREQV